MPILHRQNLLGKLIVSISASSLNEPAPWPRNININTCRQQSPLSLRTCHIGKSGACPSEFEHRYGLAITRDNQYFIAADGRYHLLYVSHGL